MVVSGAVSALILAASVAYIRSADIWASHFFESGSLYLGYSIARLIFLSYLILLPLAFGRWLSVRLFKFNPTPGLGSSLHFFFLGAAFLNLTGSIMAHASILSLYLVAPMALFLAYYVPVLLKAEIQFVRTRPRPPVILICGMALLTAEIFYLVLVKAFPPDGYVIDSLGHYLPFLQSVLDKGGIQWPTPYYIDLFFLKGSGFVFLATVITDINSFQLLSFTFFLFSAALVGYWARSLFRDSYLLPLAVVGLYLTSTFLMTGEFQKTHMMSGAFLLYLLYAILVPPPLTIFFSIVGIFAYTNPPYQIFTFLLCGAAYLRALFSKEYEQAQRIFKGSLVCGTCLLFILLLNYIATGIAELTPYNAVLKMTDPSRRPPGILLWHTRYLLYDEGSLKGTMFLHDFSYHVQLFWDFIWGSQFALKFPTITGYDPSQYGLLLTIISCGVALFREKTVRPFLALTLVLLSVIFALKSYVTQGSFSRGLTFVPALATLTLVTILYSVLNLTGRFREMAITLLAIAVATFTTWRLVRLHQLKALPSVDFATGQSSFGDFYRLPWQNPCTEAREKIAGHDRLTALHFLPSCVGNPTSKVDYIDPQNYLDGDNPIFLMPPNEARISLEKIGVKYFLFIPGFPLYLYSAAPVFDPDFVGRNLKVEARLRQGFLLSWRDSNEMPMDAETLTMYRKSFIHPENESARRFMDEWASRRAKGER